MLYTNDSTTNFIVNCKCGCGDGIEFRVDMDDEFDFISLGIITSKWYTDQATGWQKIKQRFQKIWWVIRGKEYYHTDIIMNKEQGEEFVKAVNNIKPPNIKKD